MRKIVFLASILFMALGSIAQVPQITLGTIPANILTDNGMAAQHTTSTQIINNKKLTGNDPHCIIKGYTFTISAGSDTWTTHVKGDELTPQIIRKVKEMIKPGVKVFFDNFDILYDGKKASANPVMLTYDE